ncbi:DUF6452 family protein [Flavobacterium sp.]|uniref:DUF6452 family protein n=1 Tax=Flavobacterium sp. TaxID=239 RepID=UPI0038FC2421
MIVLFSFSGCEKDDICDANTSTTPRLVIEFYDINNPSVLKTVTDLDVIGVGMTEALISSNTKSTISIPLKTTENTTSYRFILNSGTPSLLNDDIIRFDYTHENVYVSRACGYKTIFTLDPINPFTHTDATLADGLWMKQIIITENNIDNENETHVKIYF